MAQALAVLMVEDSADDAELITMELRRGGFAPEVQRVETGAEMQRAMAARNWDLILCDFQLPMFSVGEALDVLHASGQDLPFIILSSSVQAEDAVYLMKRGAHDFLNKDGLARLVPAIERELRDAGERRLRRLAEERLRTLSHAVEQNPVSVIITDSHGLIAYVNPKFVEVTGYSVSDAIGRRLDFTHMAQAGDTDFENLWSAVSAGRRWKGEFRARHRNGDELWESATISPLKDDKGDIIQFVVLKEDITERKRYEEQLLRKASFDDLTGLPNRTLLIDRITQAIASAQRLDSSTALLSIDLDRFKNINDSLGHALGDRVIQEVAKRLTTCLRDGDTLAHTGGDEFAIIIPAIDGSRTARQVAERVLSSVEPVIALDGEQIFVTASIGIALSPTDGDTPGALQRNAELAMYKAKELGRQRFHFFTEEINQRLRDRVATESRLRGAAGRGELVLHYQPVVELRHGHTVAAEALVRWRQPDGSLVGPVQFISLAEEIGLIHEIGEWVLGTACRDMAGVFSRTPFRIAVNVSPKQLQQGGFSDTVLRLLGETGLAPHCIELEITEGVLMDDTPEATANLRRLCDLGVRLSIDDFGTGYSALGYLQRYPFQTLKIDRSFVTAAPVQPNAARLVEAILTMAQSLGLEVIAEGVETEEQLAFLRERGCPLVQGYLFGKPMPAADLTALPRLGAVAA